MYVVYRGTVDQFTDGIRTELGPGTVVGLSDSLRTNYRSEYVAKDEVAVFPVYYNNMADFYNIFAEQPVYIFGFAKGAFRQCRDVFSIYDEAIEQCDSFYNFTSALYNRYKALCKKLGASCAYVDKMEDFSLLEIEDGISEWEHNYIDCLNSVDNKEIENIYGKREEIVLGVIGTCCGYMDRAFSAIRFCGFYLEEFTPILFGEDESCMFQMLYDLKKFVAERRIDPTEIDDMMKSLYDYLMTCDLYETKDISYAWNEYRNHNFHEDTQAYENALEEQNKQYADTVEHICSFAGYDEEQIEKVHLIIKTYLELEDREGKEDNERRARKAMTDTFYDLYTATFFAAIKRHEISPVVELFLNFGLLDIFAVGNEVADQLIDFSEKLFLITSDHVFTIYTWLKAIYNGEKEPSRNELDLDYRGFILEERKNGNIREEQVEAYMRNSEEKVKFEINNFFKSANRTTSGRLSTFCPLPTEEAFGAEVERMAVTVNRLRDAMGKIEDVDYAIFYREGYFTDMEANIKSEPLMHRVEPDIILLPNCGTRAMMWQECGGIKVDSPGRMVFPMFTLEDIDKLMMYCCGCFRWEICRREQGGRWNDISSDCLTSDFYDYFTFYRKNKDLSQENKDKVKALLKGSRNNMREAFTKLYATWIGYEAIGSVRLIKCERDLFAKHCMFSKKYRKSLEGHPMFADSISRFGVKQGQKAHHTRAVFDKYEKNGGKITPEIREGLDFFTM